ncbi:MAG: DUF5011 domain-containing protein, partial [Thaumarchaeota archaeon]
GTDQSNTFDGTNSYLMYYTTVWQSLTGVDLTMTLKSHTYFTGPLVSESPPGSAYTSAQSVTLAASIPSTIYYTKDGSVPTTSSTNGPSPVSGILINTDTTLKFFAKNGSNTGPVFTATYTITPPPVIQMNDNVQSLGYSTFSGRPIQTEYVDTTSLLVGKYIDTISVKLERTGSPAGTIQAGVFNSDQSVKRLFGSMDVLAVSAGSYTQYTFSLSSPQTYQIQPGDRIGIKFADGDASNYISIMTDQTNAFDGINSYLTYFTNIWQPLTTQDYFMTLSLTHFTAPVITINGANPLVLAKGMTYLEPGAKAIDAADGNLTGSIITASNVNTGTIGTYTVNYTVTNSHSFSSKATRTVSVTADTTPPVITIRGTNPVAIKLNSAYVDAGATAIDNVDGNVTSSITTQNNVNRGQVGSYTVTYTVSDKAGNTAQAVRNVSVRDDNTPPVITARGSNPLTVGHGAVYIDPGATAIDNVDGNVTSSITTQNNVNTGIIGTYTVTYNVSDKVGNAATQVTRTVNVVDVTPITAMNDTTNTYGYSAFSGRPIEAEYVTDKSILVGKSIDTIVLTMQAEGAPLVSSMMISQSSNSLVLWMQQMSLLVVTHSTHSPCQHFQYIRYSQVTELESSTPVGIHQT